MLVSKVSVLLIQPPLSSSATRSGLRPAGWQAPADDPVRRDVSVRSLLPRSTGCSACAEHDSAGDGESSIHLATADFKETVF